MNLIEEVSRRLDAVESLLPDLRHLLTTMQNEDLQIRTKSSHRDLVTKADVASEKMILELLQDRFSNDRILAEESGMHEAHDNVSDQLTWCIDPVDGTINYAHGLPLYSVSLGIMYNSKPVGGVVFLPALNDVYRGVVGMGATKNGHSIHVSTNTDLEAGLVVTGFPYNRLEILDLLTDSMRSVLKAARGIRRTGSAALDLCWLAEGRFDGHYEWNLSPWDTCGGVSILYASGGRATNLAGDEFQFTDKLLVATNGHVHDQLLKVLQSV